eukprot:1142286-Pelagomonas_calceolata.AAC.1
MLPPGRGEYGMHVTLMKRYCPEFECNGRQLKALYNCYILPHPPELAPSSACAKGMLADTGERVNLVCAVTTPALSDFRQRESRFRYALEVFAFTVRPVRLAWPFEGFLAKQLCNIYNCQNFGRLRFAKSPRKRCARISLPCSRRKGMVWFDSRYDSLLAHSTADRKISCCQVCIPIILLRAYIVPQHTLSVTWYINTLPRELRNQSPIALATVVSEAQEVQGGLAKPPN